ncbi:NPCBM/NEW2 domain-containing protein [Deinococcus sp. YIM 77859]|uniref:NPCBM/NEW2 domain-containing protein n=1 Tax=Deinococcus sp. YIM 77859 TaxID=1540221 RepID=UPI00068F1609|nr:NPCBM/NEW2 domain-containing protein [Deinococcus sp. YIM 77859]
MSYPWQDRLDPPGSNPYANGRQYAWQGVRAASVLGPQAVPGGDNYLSDVTYTSATNSWGPIEKDRSNGEQGAGDGRPLTLNGQTYTKGLGVHAHSELVYTLTTPCTAFTASVGVDDEVGSRGSVIFQVYGDGRLLYDSGRLTGASPTQAVQVDLSGVGTLRLVVTDGGDNIDYDHADWADAKVSCAPPPPPSTTSFLSDLGTLAASNGWGPFEKDRSNGEQLSGDGRPLTLNGQTYTKGLGVHAHSSLRYALGGNCTAFTASVGVDDEVGSRGSVIFQVYTDGTLAYQSPLLTGASPTQAVQVDVSGKQELRLVVTDGGDNIDYDHADWADAKVTCSSQAASVTSVTVSPSSASLPEGSSLALKADVQGTGAYSKDVTWTSSAPSVATVSPDGTVTAVAAGQATIKATSTADPSKSGSAQITVTAKSTLPPDGIRVNFQPARSAVPEGYIPDTGLAYSEARGYGWVREDSLSAASHVPLDISPNTRDRAITGVDARLNTLIHMQAVTSTSSLPNVQIPAAWEYALPNGVYTVTVSAGDPSNSFDSTHQLNIEGQVAIAAFKPTDTRKFRAATLRVNVTDGRLTVDARGGSNTKINYVIIAPGDRPSVRATNPEDAETMVAPSASMTADVNLPSSAIDLTSLTDQSVRLFEKATGAPVAASLNTSGGGDVVVLKPKTSLKSNTAYTFEITAALKDTRGTSFLPFRSSFVTGSPTTSGTNVAFEQVSLPTVPSKPYTAVEVGPDGKLYAATLTGEILRFSMLPDGTLDMPQVITSVQAAGGGPRTIIGLAFDPASTADNLILWISNNHFWDGRSDAPDWSGKITRLSGPNLETVQDYVVGLPRSIRDHATNSIAFKKGEPNVLYVLQGSNSAMGAPDNAWGNRPERLLSGALLRVDLSKITAPPLNVKTAEGGTYNPYAPGAPLTIYASGIRNAYDMVWHSNGQLYVPTNGSAAGGNTPGTPTPLPEACAQRADGPYTGPAVPALTSVGVQRDYLFRITPGGYYGHPNPARCEWVMNGGNPTDKVDPGEVTEYPVGTLPDRNWKGFAFDFGEHASPNGVIEEYTLAGNSALKNKLLVVRYSAGKDIIVLTPGGPNQDIVASQTLISGLTNFTFSPLDLTENRASGHLYVAQLDERTGSGTITLVRPK